MVAVAVTVHVPDLFNVETARDFWPIVGVQDSKRIRKDRLEEYHDLIVDYLLENDGDLGVGIVPAKDINKAGHQPSYMRVLRDAVKAPWRVGADIPDLLIVDGNQRIPNLREVRQITLVKGDQKVFAIAAASIVAKVTRDRIMRQIGEEFPRYGFRKNSGYATAQHIAALMSDGLSPFHRTKASNTAVSNAKKKQGIPAAKRKPRLTR